MGRYGPNADQISSPAIGARRELLSYQRVRPRTQFFTAAPSETAPHGFLCPRYGIEGVPQYFLVDKTGHVVDGYSARLPDEERIRNLLTSEVRLNGPDKNRDNQ